ncbi:MAG TPA: protein kinase [Bryobacteraceae bacterium]|nr:protein kinase [Bryobacteraceae bacterium]
MSPQTSQLPVGTVLFGTYEITGVLGGGGMGWVYRAVHRNQGTPRAIKVIRPDLVSDRAIKDLFDREAAALLKVQHEAIVRCFDQLQDERGVYLIMELVQGDSLAEVLKDGPLSGSQVIALKRRIAQGLAAAHAAGVVHRDISPGNIILPDGRVEEAKLIDFGVAAVHTANTGTVAGFKGNLAYASPEQFGLFGAKVGPASDIYSFGLVLAEAAGGRQVPMGQTLHEACEMRKAPPQLPLNIPPDLVAEIAPMVQPDPRQRPKSAAELLKAQPAAAVAPATAPPQPEEYAAASPSRVAAAAAPKTRRAVTWLYSGSAFLVGVVLGCYLWIYRSAPSSGHGTQAAPAAAPGGPVPASASPAAGSSSKGAVPAAAVPPSAPGNRAAAPSTPTTPAPGKSPNAAGNRTPAPQTPANGITRAQVLARADEFAQLTWVCGATNRQVSCTRAPYRSPFLPNQTVQGVPYRWGGSDGPENLVPKLRSGYAAGSHSWNGVLACAAGTDCSGFVSQAWGKRGNHPYSTRNLTDIADPVPGDVFTNLKPGDALDLPGSHVVLFAGYRPDGGPIVYEANGPASRVIRNERSTWARFRRYHALRLRNVVE